MTTIDRPIDAAFSPVSPSVSPPRAPYWLDGVIPLAWLLDDEPLKV